MDQFYPKYMKYKMKYLNLKKDVYNLDLKKEKFSNMSGGGDDLEVILFKAEWCPHCRNFIQDWESIQQSNNLNFVTVDDSNKELMKEYESKGISIQGYPTLFLGKNKEYFEFVGNSSKDNVENFIKTFKE